MNVKLSVVMPAYNEEAAIHSAVGEIQKHILDKIPNSELVVVNDGSRDKTGPILDAMASVDPRLRPIHQKNAGHGPAVIRGATEARGEYLFFLDSDRQIEIQDFHRLWDEVQKGADAAFGIRLKRHDPTLRLILTRFIRWTLWGLFGVYIRDANVPFKLFRASLWKEAAPLIPADTLAPSLFFALWIFRKGYRIQCLPIHHRERETGVGSLNVKKLLLFCKKAFSQLLLFRKGLNS